MAVIDTDVVDLLTLQEPCTDDPVLIASYCASGWAHVGDVAQYSEGYFNIVEITHDVPIEVILQLTGPIAIEPVDEVYRSVSIDAVRLPEVTAHG